MPRIGPTKLPVVDETQKEYAPVLTDTAYKHSIVDASRQPLGALLTHIEGTSWSVDYYSQVLGSSEEPSAYDKAQSGSYQQYLYIKRYELKLQAELSTTVDVTDQTVNVTGTAVMYPYMKPNVGDAFIADMGDGEAGLFTITEVEKKSFFKQACYEIQFALSDYLTQEIEDDLKSKTIKQTEFVKDFMTYGQNPIIATSDLLKHKSLENILGDSLNDWLSEFYSNEYRTILVPNGQTVTYDPFLTRMITSVFSKETYPLIKHIDMLNVDDNSLNYYTDIWTTLLQRETYMLRTCFCEYYSISSKSLNGNPFLQTAHYSGVQRIIVPVPEGNLADERLGLTPNMVGDKLHSTESYPEDPQMTVDMCATRSYVFSKNFYHPVTDGKLTKLEIMVRDYLAERRVNWQDLQTMLEDRHKLTRLERFYSVPVMLLLATSELRSM